MTLFGTAATDSKEGSKLKKNDTRDNLLFRRTEPLTVPNDP